MVRVLISGGADLNTHMVSEQDASDERTYPHWLGIYGLGTNQIYHSVRPMVHMLCGGGADVNALDYQGLSALHHIPL